MKRDFNMNDRVRQLTILEHYVEKAIDKNSKIRHNNYDIRFMRINGKLNEVLTLINEVKCEEENAIAYIKECIGEEL